MSWSRPLDQDRAAQDGAPTMLRYFKIRQTGGTVETESHWEALSTPCPIPGFPLPYGGSVLGSCICAGFASLGEQTDKSLFSLMGHYLYPLTMEHKVRMSIRRIRHNRKFSTLDIIASQPDKNGEDVPRILVTLDFIAVPPEGLPTALDFSVKPRSLSTDPDAALPVKEALTALRGRPGIPDQVLDAMLSTGEDDGWHSLRQARYPKEDLAHQTLWGFASKAPTTQDGRQLVDTLESSFARLLDGDEERRLTVNERDECAPISRRAMNAAAAAMFLDAQHPDMATHGAHLGRNDVNNFASLDIAMRFMDELDLLADWHLMEHFTYAGSSGRTFGEARLFNRSGKMLVSCSCVCILTPKKSKL